MDSDFFVFHILPHYIRFPYLWGTQSIFMTLIPLSLSFVLLFLPPSARLFSCVSAWLIFSWVLGIMTSMLSGADFTGFFKTALDFVPAGSQVPWAQRGSLEACF